VKQLRRSNCQNDKGYTQQQKMKVFFVDVALQNLRNGNFTDTDKAIKSKKYGTKTKHITTIKNILNAMNTKAHARNIILKETDRLSSYKDKHM
jgi:Ni,Fe-hydrogenase maturation factor